MTAFAKFDGLFVKGGIGCVEVLGIQIVLRDTDGIAEALEMDDFSRPQEFNGIPYVRIVGEAKDIVVGGTCLLLCPNHVFATF